ncbi:YkvA family protein [Micromonospora matsumotoense]|uniref:YkvA family protein n=1 Tax=Micromonospora matsumotoense TaxID=121616 RepID=UPI0033EF6EEF
MSREMWALVVVGGILALATLVGAVLLAIRVIRTRRLLGTLGVGGKVAFYGALIYTVLPVDVLPDPIYLDDMGVLAGALIYLGRLAHRRRTADRPPPGHAGALPDGSGTAPDQGQPRQIVS